MGLLDAPELLVKERFRWDWLPNIYDLIDPVTQAVLAIATERPRGRWSHLRRVLHRGHTSAAEFHVDVSDVQGRPLFTIHRPGGYHWRYPVQDAAGPPLGTCEYRSQFELFDPSGAKLCWFSPSNRNPVWELTGRKSKGGPILATVTWKWPGIRKLLHPMKDTNMWNIRFEPAADGTLRYLTLAVPIIMDLQMYERGLFFGD